MDVIWRKVIRVSLLAINRHLFSLFKRSARVLECYPMQAAFCPQDCNGKQTNFPTFSILLTQRKYYQIRTMSSCTPPGRKSFLYRKLCPPPSQDFQASSSSIALVGSILAGVYMLVGPIAAASVNRLVVELKGR